MKKRLQENRYTRSCAPIQETYAGDFSCLLRVGGNAKRKEQSAKRKAKNVFLTGFSSPWPPMRSSAFPWCGTPRFLSQSHIRF